MPSKSIQSLNSNISAVGRDGYRSYFSTVEGNECIINQADSIEKGGAHVYWEIEVEDPLGNIYGWEDHSTAGDSDAATLRASILTHLTEVVLPSNDDQRLALTIDEDKVSIVGKRVDGTTDA